VLTGDLNSEWRFVYKVENESAINVLRTRLPDALRLSGLVLSLQCRENRPVFSACSPHAVSGLGF
ncbi:hypothetical protein, partial [Escherichia coli]|uniref:hypothetical protein n=1 Tax=Escherichia coli TaxID=562 RepID=UPI002280DE57